MEKAMVKEADNLAPVRIGNGRAVHLGYICNETQPDGGALYASWCKAGQRDGVITKGPAVGDPVDCVRCTRQHVFGVDSVNAGLGKASQ